MEINVVDTGDSGLMRVVMTLKSLNQPVIEMLPGPNGVERMVTEVIKKAGCMNSIQVLRIYAHGMPGAINIAGGQIDESDTLSAISVSNFDKIEGSLRRLAPYFSSNARVELLGCDVALDSSKKISANSSGETLLTKLAKVLGVDVLASGNPKELPLGSVKFVGLVVKATPGGGLTSTTAPEISKIQGAGR